MTPKDHLIEVMARAEYEAIMSMASKVLPWASLNKASVKIRLSGMSAALDALISAGWLPVPVEATEEMHLASQEVDRPCDHAYGGTVALESFVAVEAYAAMLKASPMNQKPEGEG